MIVGIGVDITETARVEKLVVRFGERFARRILTSDVLGEFDRRGQSSSYLATRFAGKEATAKALGTGIGEQFGFHSVQIEHDNQGKPVLKVLDSALELIASLDVKNAMISLSDEKNYAVAMVVLES